jgi:CHAT domain-containing protein/tetratricopeptide (TPR) repeat protein
MKHARKPRVPTGAVVATAMAALVLWGTAENTASAQLGAFGKAMAKKMLAGDERGQLAQQIGELQAAGRLEEAIVLAEELVALDEANNHGPMAMINAQKLAASRNILANLFRQTGQHEKALALSQKSAEDAASGPLSRLVQDNPAMYLRTYGKDLRLLKDYSLTEQHEKADELGQSMLAKFSAAGNPATLERLRVLRILGDNALAMGADEKARGYFESALAEVVVVQQPVTTKEEPTLDTTVALLSGGFRAASEMAQGLATNNPTEDVVVTLPSGEKKVIRRPEFPLSDFAAPFAALAVLYGAAGEADKLTGLYDGSYQAFRERAAVTKDMGALGALGAGETEAIDCRFAQALSKVDLAARADRAFSDCLAANDARLASVAGTFALTNPGRSFVVRRGYVSGWLAHVERNRDANVELAFQAASSSKGGGIEFGRLVNQVAGSSNSGAARKDYERLVALQKQLDREVQAGIVADNNRKSSPLHREFAELWPRVRMALGPEINAAYGRSALRFGAITAPATTARLSPDSAFLDIYKYAPPVLSATGSVEPARYGAFVLEPGKAIRFVPLGDASRIDGAIQRFLVEVRSVATQGQVPNLARWIAASRQVFDVVIQPLFEGRSLPHVLLIAPDGELSVVPFDAIAGMNDNFLVDQTDIRYASSVRDLHRSSVESHSTRPSLVIGDPSFDAGQPSTAAATSAPTLQLRTIGGSSLRDTTFQPLPDTLMEAQLVQRALEGLQPGKVTLLSSESASVEAVRNAQAPRFLHLATHGFYLDEGSDSPQQAGNPVMTRLDPGSLSGVALAGANPALRNGSVAGLLFASDMAEINLIGTQLVVLSACDTGLGMIRAGEGVLGARSALAIAGAHASLTTLWSVSSAETAEFIADFYSRVASGSSTVLSVREAKLALKQKYPNPYYWGAFVLSGSTM